MECSIVLRNEHQLTTERRRKSVSVEGRGKKS